MADPLAEAQLAAYVKAVIQALTNMTALESSRLTWAMLQHLWPTTDALAFAARGAIDALAAAIGGEVFLAVSRDDGSHVLTNFPVFWPGRATGAFVAVELEDQRLPSVLALENGAGRTKGLRALRLRTERAPTGFRTGADPKG